MYFNGKIQVIIGDKELKTVTSISAKNDSQHIGSDCELVVPLNCRIQYINGTKDFLTDYTKNLFKSGDTISVKAKYEGFDWINVFSGYVVDFIEGNPMTIKCTDYIYLLNLTTIDVSYKNISLKNLLLSILKGTGITLAEPIMNLNLENITFRLMSPAAILEWLKKELGINISLSGTKLYCNLASNTLSTVKFSTNRNVMKSDLQKPASTFLKYKVKAWFIREDGKKDSYEVGDSAGQLREVFYYKVVPRTEAHYKELAKEALTKFKQMRYTGNITTYLYPDCDLFWQAQYRDIRYPDRSANYVITGMNIDLNESGFHRTIKLSYLSEIL